MLAAPHSLFGPARLRARGVGLAPRRPAHAPAGRPRRPARGRPLAPGARAGPARGRPPPLRRRLGPGCRAPLRRSGDVESERFSPDATGCRGWCSSPRAPTCGSTSSPASTGAPITRLDQIPDEELDRLAAWGFTGLWLIGLWERSRASRRIKQLCGNPDGRRLGLFAARLRHRRRPRAARRPGARCASARPRAASAWPATWCPTTWASTRAGSSNTPTGSCRSPSARFPSYTFSGPDLSSDRARRALHRGSLLRPHRRGGGLQAGGRGDRRRRATSTTATTAPACRGTTPRSSTT